MTAEHIGMCIDTPVCIYVIGYIAGVQVGRRIDIHIWT